jgi:hypothetical protein
MNTNSLLKEKSKIKKKSTINSNIKKLDSLLINNESVNKKSAILEKTDNKNIYYNEKLDPILSINPIPNKIKTEKSVKKIRLEEKSTPNIIDDKIKNSQEKIGFNYNIDYKNKANNEANFSQVSKDNNQLLLKRRNFGSDGKKNFNTTMKSNTFNSEDMYKKFNQEFEFKKIKNTIINKAAKGKEEKNIQFENKSNIIIENSEGKKIKKSFDFRPQDQFSSSKSNYQPNYKQSSSLNYNFGVNFLKSPERQNLNTYLIKKLENNSYFLSPEKKLKNNYLNSFSFFNGELSPNSQQSKVEKHSKTNKAGEDNDNLNIKKSISSLKSDISGKSDVSEDSSKYNYNMFKKRENSLKSNTQDKFIENLRSSNPNTLEDNQQKSTLFPPRMRSSNKIILNEGDNEIKKCLILNKSSIRSIGSINQLSTKFNFIKIKSITNIKEDNRNIEIDNIQIKRNNLDNSKTDFSHNINERAIPKMSNFYFNYFK